MTLARVRVVTAGFLSWLNDFTCSAFTCKNATRVFYKVFAIEEGSVLSRVQRRGPESGALAWVFFFNLCPCLCYDTANAQLTSLTNVCDANLTWKSCCSDEFCCSASPVLFTDANLFAHSVRGLQHKLFKNGTAGAASCIASAT